MVDLYPELFKNTMYNVNGWILFILAWWRVSTLLCVFFDTVWYLNTKNKEWWAINSVSHCTRIILFYSWSVYKYHHWCSTLTILYITYYSSKMFCLFFSWQMRYLASCRVYGRITYKISWSQRPNTMTRWRLLWRKLYWPVAVSMAGEKMGKGVGMIKISKRSKVTVT